MTLLISSKYRKCDITIARDGVRNFGLREPMSNYLVVSNNSKKKKNSKCYLYVFVHWFNQYKFLLALNKTK